MGIPRNQTINQPSKPPVTVCSSICLSHLSIHVPSVSFTHSIPSFLPSFHPIIHQSTNSTTTLRLSVHPSFCLPAHPFISLKIRLLSKSDAHLHYKLLKSYLYGCGMTGGWMGGFGLMSGWVDGWWMDRQADEYVNE